MTREDLKDYKYNQEWIKGRLEYIEEYRISITNITSVISDMPKGSREVQDSMAEKLSTLIDTTNELLEKTLLGNKFSVREDGDTLSFRLRDVYRD